MQFLTISLVLALYDLKAVGEWVSDSVSYHNAYGKTCKLLLTTTCNKRF